MENNFSPALTGLNQLEAAVLMEKYVMILGMINYGTPEQKTIARKELVQLDTIIHQHVDGVAFGSAERKLNLSEEDLEFIQKV
ncbi:hypothetical protein [Ammoniphilus resinae]|uniref:Uncharacterized protein n=1 Tax=Ammoniphilus resinae TaxID=861532 RepID=A0ABS4GNM7_9BACL|nr:hypothetical protein [Ammoniphilus resinae]MBP1931864.1 hypothetical protein [Ammoniphilus resinae]